MRRWILAALALAGILPISVRAYLHFETRVSVASHGLQITLAAPRRTYPRNAIIPVTLLLRNISDHPISIMSGLNAPRVAVLDASGQEVYDPLNPLGELTLVTLKGPGPRSFRLLPGKSWTSLGYIVLRGDTLTTQILLGDVRHLSHEMSLRPLRLRLRLTDDPAPRVVLSPSPLQVRLSPPSPESTSFVSFSQNQCDNTFTSSGWVTGDRGALMPGGENACSTYIWHAIAGWVDHSAATISYMASPEMVTVSTTPPPTPKPPEALSPAAGVCRAAEGAVAVVQLNVDTPSPRCMVVKPDQRLLVINKTGKALRVRLADIAVQLQPGQDLTIDQPFGAYLADGVHDLSASAYAGGGAELWLRP